MGLSCDFRDSADVSAPILSQYLFQKGNGEGGSTLDKYSLSTGNLSAKASPLALQCRAEPYLQYLKCSPPTFSSYMPARSRASYVFHTQETFDDQIDEQKKVGGQKE